MDKVKEAIQKTAVQLGWQLSTRPPFAYRVNPFKRSRRFDSYMTPKLLAPTDVLAEVDPTVPPGVLSSLWTESKKGHKFHHYFPVYEKELMPFRGTECRMLEIGVQYGGPTRMWRAFLGDRATVVGIDIDSQCERYSDPENGIHIRIGSQENIEFLERIVREFGPFDIVLDDGSHMVTHMITSFGHLFGDGLREGGIYIVEDIHANYWSSHRDIDASFFDFAKYLTDLMHEYDREPDYVYGQFHPNSPHRKASVSVPRIAMLLESIEIFRSLAVLRRYKTVPFLPVVERLEETRGDVAWNARVSDVRFS